VQLVRLVGRAPQEQQVPQATTVRAVRQGQQGSRVLLVLREIQVEAHRVLLVHLDPVALLAPLALWGFVVQTGVQVCRDPLDLLVQAQVQEAICARVLMNVGQTMEGVHSCVLTQRTVTFVLVV